MEIGRSPRHSLAAYQHSRHHHTVQPPHLSNPSLYASHSQTEHPHRTSAFSEPSAMTKGTDSAHSYPPAPTWHPAPDRRARYHDRHQVQSRAYQVHEPNKPSLPGIASILGGAGRSPPLTPPPKGVPLQPHPREPVYEHSANHLPPALYPNKRTRTDSGWADTGERKPEISLPYMPAREDASNGRRPFDLPTPTNGSPTSYYQKPTDESINGRLSTRSSLSHGTSPETRARGLEASRAPFYESGGLAASYEDNRRLSLYSNSSNPRDPHAGDPPRAPGSQHSLGYRENSYSASAGSEVPHGYNSSVYPYSQTFFVPSHYEYQNGKSRKRSNLPKHSTEIMKRWFDENMHNPYPSEEQKRQFATVAGINLTQVSNWFINHRRRCPELKEKRDKGRSEGRDDDI